MLEFKTWLENDHEWGDWLDRFRRALQMDDCYEVFTLAKHLGRGHAQLPDHADFEKHILFPLAQFRDKFASRDEREWAMRGTDENASRRKLIDKAMDALRDRFKIPEDIFPDERPKFYPPLW